MGTDCKWFVNEWGPDFRRVHQGRMFVTTILDLSRDYNCFQLLPGFAEVRGGKVNGMRDPAEMQGKQVDFDVMLPATESREATRVDSYGLPLLYVAAGQLAAAPWPELSAFNRAAVAYVSALPPETEVVLYWD